MDQNFSLANLIFTNIFIYLKSENDLMKTLTYSPSPPRWWNRNKSINIAIAFVIMYTEALKNILISPQTWFYFSCLYQTYICVKVC